VPHYPVVPSKEYVGRTSVGAYGDFVVQMDESVGAVVAALERAGVRDDTLVIFTSDNGPEVAGEVPQSAYERFREHGHDSRGGFRGVKRDLWEGGHRVPFIAHWPARIEPGRVSDETVSGVDVAATLASLMDLPIPERAAGDSVDFSPVLLDEDYESPLREALIYQACDRTLAIRQGDWVLIQSKTGDRNAKNGEPAWLKEQEGYTPHDQPGELFNLKEDPQQKHNVYAENLPVVGKLSILLGRYIAEGRSVPIRTTEE
jgi:arylsulfatase A-like enzyme